uniref:HIRAN domain-containing protein n=1 Tax=viral metagenome TaxID=1070528 RepID=A0A6C0IW13_9ZZZZ
MSDAYNYINNKDYLKIPLVGNNYTDNKITNRDIDIRLIFDTKNKYDKNAIRVVSVKNNKLYNIGFVSKDRTFLIKNLFNKLEFISIIKRTISAHTTYYYLIYKKSII